MSKVQKAKFRLDELRVKLDEAQQDGDTQTTSDLLYGTIPDKKKQAYQISGNKEGHGRQ